MDSIRRRLPTPGVVLGMVALIVAVTGTAVALPGRDTVNSGDIKKNAVRSSDVRTDAINASEIGGDAVGGAEIQRNAVGASEIGGDAVGGAEIQRNAVGASEIADDAVGGAEVDESALGKVPSATSADAVGGKSAAQLDTRWVLIAENGTIERQTGGFSVIDCYQTNANCYIDAGEDIRDKGLHAQIAVANTDGSSILSGETGVAACGVASVACAPPTTENDNVLVVAPRASDGTVPGGVTPPAPADAARFYVFVTGSAG